MSKPSSEFSKHGLTRYGNSNLLSFYHVKVIYNYASIIRSNANYMTVDFTTISTSNVL